MFSLTLLSLAFVSCGSSKSAKISDVTISGKVNEEITTAQTIEIKLSGMEFKAIAQTVDVSKWFAAENLPAGLTVALKEAVAAGATSLTINVTGKPTATSDKAISMTIPKDYIKEADKDVEVKSNSKAKFDIKAAENTNTPAASATVANVTITGTTGTAIADANVVDVVITIANDKIKEAIAVGTSVKGWITNLPAGLDAKIKTAVAAGATSLTINVTGTPSAASTAALAITIPAANLNGNKALTVTANANAKFNISAAAPVDNTPSATIVADQPVAITGIQNQPITNKDITIKLTNAEFKNFGGPETPVTGWITNLTGTGLIAVVNEPITDTTADKKQITITIQGSSSVAIPLANLAITIPANVLSVDSAITVTNENKATIEITAAN